MEQGLNDTYSEIVEALLAQDCDDFVVGGEIVNPGSVGAPLDGDPRAAWALYTKGEVRFRRTDYDVERAAAQMRSLGEWADPIAHRIEHGSDRRT